MSSKYWRDGGSNTLLNFSQSAQKGIFTKHKMEIILLYWSPYIPSQDLTLETKILFGRQQPKYLEFMHLIFSILEHSSKLQGNKQTVIEYLPSFRHHADKVS